MMQDAVARQDAADLLLDAQEFRHDVTRESLALTEQVLTEQVLQGFFSKEKPISMIEAAICTCCLRFR